MTEFDWKTLNTIDINELEHTLASLPILSKANIHSILNAVDDVKHLEMIGKFFSFKQMLEALTCIEKYSDKLLKKLAPLLVGMSQVNFRKMIANSLPHQFDTLKQVAATEGMQYHLTILSHELSSELEGYIKTLEITAKEFNSYPLEDICIKDIKKAFRTIHLLFTAGMHIKEEAAHSLSLAWLSARTDLIEQLGQIKEISERVAYDSSGSAHSGLQEILNNRLNTVFSGKNELEVLKDDTPALDALARFSVWYPRDYHEIGLLPNFKENQLPSDEITQQVNDRLNKLNLNTIADFKREYIYSKKALKDYIKTSLIKN